VSGNRSRWGWYRLTDDWAATLVEEAGVDDGDLVVDLGAGAGAITAALVRAGAQVVAVELHPGRASTLRERFADHRVTVVEAHAAEVRLPRRPFRVVANPPFACGSAIVRRLLGPGLRLTSADLVLPAQVAQRWARGPRARVARRLPRSAFQPAARVGTAVLHIGRR
jgi:23S rRNA (adenine-N6)-dimethyltransferase